MAAKLCSLKVTEIMYLAKNSRVLFGIILAATPSVVGAHGVRELVGENAKGFIKTGADLSPEELAAAGWPLARPPYFLETSVPRVFAVGDVRSGNIERVASAVEEGTASAALVHQVLHE